MTRIIDLNLETSPAAADRLLIAKAGTGEWFAVQWSVVGGGSGAVAGPTGGATDNALARFDGTTGALVQDSLAVLTDAGALTLNGLPVGPTLPASRTMTSGNLATTDVGQYVAVGGDITIPNSTFGQGDLITLVNNSATDRTITASVTSCFVSGADVASFTLAGRGMATLLFTSATECYATGAIS